MYPPLPLPHTGAGMWWRICLAFARQSVLQCSSQSDVCNIGITAIVNAHTAFHARSAPTHTPCSRLDWFSPLLACSSLVRGSLSGTASLARYAASLDADFLFHLDAAIRHACIHGCLADLSQLAFLFLRECASTRLRTRHQSPPLLY
ncbi:hypothetical protein IWX49DRAFT_291733 [Phyllosticta citricarpa]